MDRVPAHRIDVDAVCRILERGGVVCLPTDTCYALSVDAVSDAAVARMHQVKRRTAIRAKSIVFSDEEMLKEWVRTDPIWDCLNRTFLPGPLTLILPRQRRLAEGLNPDARRIATRLIDHPLPAAVVRVLGRPITCTSANQRGLPPLYDPDVIQETFKEEIDVLVDAGTLPGVRPSTIIDLIASPPALVRPGPISLTDIYNALIGCGLFDPKVLAGLLLNQAETAVVGLLSEAASKRDRGCR